MAKKKEFKVGLYAVIVSIVLAVVLGAITVFAFRTRYTAYSPEKVAVQFADTIVQTGDGYNAYKNTLLAQNPKLKYGDFIRNAYMRPYVNEDAPQAEFVGTGSAEEQEKIDTVYNLMYEYYVGLLEHVGWDDYDTFFTSYFEKLVEVRHQIYGDDFMNTDYMFSALEANAATYGESLTGAEEQIADDGKTVLRKATQGLYQQMYGADYRLTVTVAAKEELSVDNAEDYISALEERLTDAVEKGTVKAAGDTAMLSAFEGLSCAGEVNAVELLTVTISAGDSISATVEIPVVRIGNSWYVDNTNIDTSGLYLAK